MTRWLETQETDFYQEGSTKFVPRLGKCISFDKVCVEKQWYIKYFCFIDLYLSISLDNNQLDAHLLYFTIRPLQSSTCFEHYMLIIRRLNRIDKASGIVLSVSGRPVYRLRENCRAVLSQTVHRKVTD